MTTGKLVFNEIYASPASGEAEWLEIYNLGETVELAGWKIKDASANQEFLVNEVAEGSASSSIRLEKNKWRVLETKKVSLNNGGDTLYLYAPNGELVDEITYPSLNKKSYARVTDGGETWQVTGIVTKGTSNVVTDEETGAANTNLKAAETSAEEEVASYNLVAKEFYPCPESGEKEWLRLQNLGGAAVNLLGFRVKNGASSSARTLGDVTLNAGASAKIEFTSGVAPNGGGTVILVEPGGETVTEIEYAACSVKGVTLVLENGKWVEKTVGGTTSTTESEETENEKATVVTEKEMEKAGVVNNASGNWRIGKSFAAPKYQYKTESGGRVLGAATVEASGESGLENYLGGTVKIAGWQKVGLTSLAIAVIIGELLATAIAIYMWWLEKNQGGENDSKTDEQNFPLVNY